jgi:DNA-binding beta-propeller fold protein YncE
MHPNGKAYFFVGDKYYRFDFKADAVGKMGTVGVDGWKGLPAGSHAAIMHPNGKAYFFVGDKYYRFDFTADAVDKTGTVGVDEWKGLYVGRYSGCIFERCDGIANLSVEHYVSPGEYAG